MAPLGSIPLGLALCGVLGFAQTAAAGDTPGEWSQPEEQSRLDRDASTPDGAERVREKLAAKFDVHESVIGKLRERGLGYGEIDHALTLASRGPDGLTRENVRHVVELRQDQRMGWGQIAREMDTTMGEAKRDFRASPPPTDGPGAEPKSVSRSGKSSAKAHASSARSHSGMGVSRSGTNDRASGKASASSSGRAHGQAFGGGSGQASSSKSNGKAKGHK